MTNTDNLAKARKAKAAKAAQRQRAGVKQAQAWLKAMREESHARAAYTEADEPRAKERARKYWLHTLDAWASVGTPKDEFVREARKLERSDT